MRITFVKINNCFSYYLLIQLCLFKSCLNSKVYEKDESPSFNTVPLSNGPLDLPSGVTINLGLRRRKYSSNEPKNNTYLKNELNDDAKIIKDAINKTNFGKPEWDNNSVEEKLSYDFPPWLSEMISFSDKSKSTLGSLGVDNLPDLNECKNIKHFPKQMLCIIEGLDRIKEVYENAKDITSLTARVLAGGRLAVRALTRLKTLASSLENKQLMKSLGTPMATLILLQRESTSDRNRWLCGSILTLLTDLPVVSDLADVKTGSYGHVNVIMPRQSRVRNADRNILRLREGASPSYLINGYTSIQANYTT
ncbi:hypothetical protein PFHG_03292 [Plasmodium falciparum HB3]|uniref:Uncharacterized protein n=1 Tax=Plasmodium falciparum (isolate HB3) TaxID=137071 RepID=A0A0L7KEJ4_PLAFX|nr:hypothetical protein PFHG_03292 [Plasmodium falciparum HB3]